MVGASKILTVSYGTFSCTLEGFDDPFNTMKAIAEYFRDLAAEDRYFGAEPPQPDAAMLHRIAEREIQRRVEAKIQENGVILRAGEAEAPALPQVPLASPAAADDAAAAKATVAPAAPAAEPVAVARAHEPVAEAARPVVHIPAREPQAAPPAAPVLHDQAEISESVAAKLARIRAAQTAAQTAAATTIAAPVAAPAAAPSVVEAPLVETPEAVALPADDEYSEDQHAGFAAGDEVADVLSALSEQPADVMPETVADEVAAEVAEDMLPESTGGADDLATGDLNDILPEDYAEAVEDALADDLQELSAPPADAEAATYEEGDLSSILAQLEAPAEPQAAASPLMGEADDDEDLAILDELKPEADPFGADIAEPEAPLAVDVADGLAEDVAEDVAADAAEARDIWAEEDEDLSTGFEDEDEPVAEPAAQEPEAPEAQVAAAEPLDAEAAESDAPPVAGKIERARARVIKVRRVTPAEGRANSQDTAEPPIAANADTQAEDRPTEAAGADPADGRLSPEAEADLMRELAALEDEAEAPPAQGTVRPARPVLPTRPGRRTLERNSGEDAVTRLIAKTDSEMHGPENRRRLSAIAHLKAAVAATVAERKVAGEAKSSDNDRIDPYKSDLSRIVRPATGEPARPTGATERPTPLVLVSEQRVDRRASDGAAPAQPSPVAAPVASPVAAPAPGGPIRPRRIVTGGAAAAVADDFDDEDDDIAGDDANIFVDNAGFAEFADRLGAESLSELLEAAAAYTSTVEGRPHFTRPQIIRQVNAIQSVEIPSREDSLRSFGNLLRAGKIQRVKRGQYALTDLSHLLSEAKKITG